MHNGPWFATSGQIVKRGRNIMADHHAAKTQSRIRVDDGESVGYQPDRISMKCGTARVNTNGHI